MDWAGAERPLVRAGWGRQPGAPTWRDEGLLAALLALWCVAIAGLVARRLAALAGGVRPSSALGGGHDAAAAGAAAARDPKA